MRSQEEVDIEMSFIVCQYQNVIERSDKQNKLFNSLADKLDSLRLDVQRFDSYMSELKDNILYLTNCYESLKNEHNFSNNNLLDRLKKLADDQNQRNNDLLTFKEIANVNGLSRVNERFSDLDSRITQLQNAAKEHLDYCKVKINNICDEHKNHYDLTCSLDSKTELLKNGLKDNKDSMQSLTAVVYNVDNKYNNIKNCLESYKSEILSQVQEFQTRLLGSVQTHIENIEIPIISHLATKAEVQENTKHNERVILDSNNANLRSSNNEKKIDIIERKLENIYLIIKKLELGS